MIQLYQFPWSPFCLVTRRILEYGRIPHRLVNVLSGERSLIWKLTRQRYYQVPVIKHGRDVIFETSDNSQVIAKYLSEKFSLDLFPEEHRGVQSVLWQWIEDRVEGAGFKLNDIYFEEFVSKADRLGFIRHKERKFGRGCLERWREQQVELLAEFSAALLPFDQMLLTRPFLLGGRPHFVDFDLCGMIGNFLYSGHYEFPVEHPRLHEWFDRVRRIKRDVPK
jgi:glutathione S-transferase